MKQLLIIALMSIFLTSFTIKKFNTKAITQMVVTLPDLSSKMLLKDLETDIHNLSGIQFIETSLRSKTLVLNYDSNKLSPDEVAHILYKWGCNPGESFFHALD